MIPPEPPAFSNLINALIALGAARQQAPAAPQSRQFGQQLEGGYTPYGRPQFAGWAAQHQNASPVAALVHTILGGGAPAPQTDPTAAFKAILAHLGAAPGFRGGGYVPPTPPQV